MAELSEPRPTQHHLVIDLVKAAGVDVSDWANFKGGAKSAASNPKYCYEWAFVEPGKVVVLNLWHAEMEKRKGVIVRELNMRDTAYQYGGLPGRAVWRTRARKMDHAIQTAWREQLPVRVIVCEGEMRRIANAGARASTVHKRLLDPVPWAVTSYESDSGECMLSRGARPKRFVDQFPIQQDETPNVKRRTVTGEIAIRNPQVRERALLRAQGRCEWCGDSGFTMPDDTIYLETHHIIPLSEDGPDTDKNVVALCPNHHREAHHGKDMMIMRERLLARLKNDAEPPHAPDRLPRASPASAGR